MVPKQEGGSVSKSMVLLLNAATAASGWHDARCVRCRRGKLLNVRDASVTQINGNAEINAIKQILGLQHGKARALHRCMQDAHAVPDL